MVDGVFMDGRLDFNRARGACKINPSDIVVMQNGRIAEVKTLLERRIPKDRPIIDNHEHRAMPLFNSISLEPWTQKTYSAMADFISP